MNIDAAPFYATQFIKEPLGGPHFHENLKRTRSGNTTNFRREGNQAGGETRQISSVSNGNNQERRENNMIRRSLSFEKIPNKPVDFLPDDKDFNEAIISAVLSTIDSKNSAGKNKRAVAANKRLKVFQDITLSLSPRA